MSFPLPGKVLVYDDNYHHRLYIFPRSRSEAYPSRSEAYPVPFVFGLDSVLVGRFDPLATACMPLVSMDFTWLFVSSYVLAMSRHF